MQHYIILLRAIISSLYFNFKYLPFNQALKLPILLYKPYFKELKGKVVIDSSNIYFGMIRMGFGVHYNIPIVALHGKTKVEL